MKTAEEIIIYPEIFFGHPVAGFFTGRHPGADREALSYLVGIPAEKIFFPVQRHTDNVVVFEENFIQNPPEADAVITDKPGFLLGVQVADCVPILIYDPARRVAAAVHAGWRGTAAGILKKTAARMAAEFGSHASDLLVATGPSIRWCCYEVDRDVLERVERETGPGEYFQEKETGKICLDLPAANFYQAKSAGIPEENIQVKSECTFCYPERFHSYRRERAAGRQGGYILISPGR